MSPKYNPKHKKRKGTPITSKASKKYRINKALIAGFIIIGVIAVSIVGVFGGLAGYEEWAQSHVQVGDEVTVELWLYLANDEGQNVTGVVWNNTDDLWTFTMNEAANETATSHGGLPYGLWEQLNGMKVDTVREKLWLPRCVDDMIPIPDVDFNDEAIAGDGYDDRKPPGRRGSLCYSYGYDTTSEFGINLRFTPIIFWVHVIAIEKGE